MTEKHLQTSGTRRPTLTFGAPNAQVIGTNFSADYPLQTFRKLTVAEVRY